MPAVSPTPVARQSQTVSTPLRETDAATLCALDRALDDCVRLDLYATNPCRTLGVFPAVEATTLVERVQTLLAAPLQPDWAFAPTLPLSPEQLRRAGLAADNSADRLVGELFWFWPESYPENKPDGALADLAAGNAEAAYGRWLASGGKGYAAHNMAVMFHYAALGRELEHGPLDEEARSWWTAAAEQWTAALATEDFWVRYAGRWAQDGAVAVARVRAELPQLLGMLSLLAAAERARRDELAEAHWLREFAVRRLADAAGLERAIASITEAELARSEELVAEAGARLKVDSEPCLRHVVEMLRQVAARRRVIEAIAGADSPPLRRLGTCVVEAGLAGLAEHARRANAESAVLPWLLHLACWPAGAETRKGVAMAGAAEWDRLIAAAQAATDGKTSRHEAVLRICNETLAPAAEQFSWDHRVQAAYRQRVVQRLRELARAAWMELGEFEVSAQACVLAAELCDEESSPLVVRERRQLWQQYQRAQNGALTLEFSGARLEIDSHRLRFDGREWPVATLNGLRFGVAEGLGGEGPQVTWYAGRDAMTLDTMTWFDPADGGTERYRQVSEALDACVVPALAARLVERVRGGQSVVLGQSALRPDGFVFQRRLGQLTPDTIVPYSQVTQRVAEGEIVLGRTDDPSVAVRYALASVWNAVAMPEVLARLTEA
jgi:hypothetical protein